MLVDMWILVDYLCPSLIVSLNSSLTGVELHNVRRGTGSQGERPGLVDFKLGVQVLIPDNYQQVLL